MGSEATTNAQSCPTSAVRLTSTTGSSPVIKFDISLGQHAADNIDNSDCSECYYRPGDELTGDVVLVLSSAMRVSSMVVELRGEASVSCKADELVDTATALTAASSVPVTGRRRRKSCTRWYQANELYVDERQEMLIAADDHILQPGEHRFPLSFQLPRGLPTSFRGKYGGVSYVVRASFVDQTSRSSHCLAAVSYVVCEPFIVRRVSSAPSSSQSKPVTIRLSRRLRAAAPFICASGVLRVDFTVTDGTVYRLGDDIHVTVRVANHSPRVLVDVVVSVVQLCEFRAQTARRRCVALVSRRCDADGRLTPAGYADTGRCTQFRLNVPTDLPESPLDCCDIIDVGYELRFAIEVVTLVISQLDDTALLDTRAGNVSMGHGS